MNRQRKAMMGGGIFFGLSMFVIFLATDSLRRPSWDIALVFVICLLGGLAFWALMELFLKLANRYTNAQTLVHRVRTKRERAISLASIPFVAAPALYFASADTEYLWPFLASNLVPFFAMSRFHGREVGMTQLLLRAGISVVLGTAVFAGCYVYLVKGQTGAPDANTLVVAAVSTFLVALSYVLSTYANRISPKQPIATE